MLKETRTYEELSEVTGVARGRPESVRQRSRASWYRPRERSRQAVGRDALADELLARVEFDDEGYVDNSGVVFDQSFLDLVAPVAAETFEFESPDVVLTAATDGITLGAAMASFFDARLAYAKKSKETAVEEFIESRQRLASGIELTYYLPAGAINAGDTVLVVDDLIRSGETQELLLDIALQADADVTGVFTLIAVGDKGMKRARRSPTPRLAR